MPKPSLQPATASSTPVCPSCQEGVSFPADNPPRNKSIFHNPTVRSILVALRIPLFALAASFVSLIVDKNWLLVGIGISLFGQFIQSWSFASLNKNSTLAIQGPYTMVRNPMYLGRYFLILGFLVITGIWVLPAAFTLLYWFYMDARVAREERRLREIFGATYAQYCKDTRRFLPTPPRSLRKLTYWNWQLFAQNNAGRNLALTLVAWLAISLFAHSEIPSAVVAWALNK